MFLVRKLLLYLWDFFTENDSGFKFTVDFPVKL